MINQEVKISRHLLWEFNLQTFDFEKSKSIVIERVVERGSLQDWRAIYKAYGADVILEVVRSSKQLSKKDKGFTSIFISSSLLHAA